MTTTKHQPDTSPSIAPAPPLLWERGLGGEVRSPWPLVPLSEVLRQRKQFIQIDDTCEYKRCRVQLHAQGVVLRDIVSSIEVKTKSQQVCRSGEFLVAEIDAKVGGFGIVPPALDGAIVSSHYFLFVLDESRLDQRFLDFYVRTHAFQEQVTAQGSTNYAAIRPGDVLSYTIPLPPLDEQRRIVARIEAMASRIEEARRLRQEAITEAKAATDAIRNAVIGQVDLAWRPLREVVLRVENGHSPACEPRPAEDDEWGVLKAGAVSFGYFNSLENKVLAPTYEPDFRYEVRNGDFLMTRANTRELVGACAIVRSTRPKLMLSDKTFRFKFRTGASVDLEYLNHVLKSPALRQQIERKATGTSPTMKNISKDSVLDLLIPAHSYDEQRHLVEHLLSVQASLDTLKRQQAQTLTELNALLPAVLDRAFRGEL